MFLVMILIITLTLVVVIVMIIKMVVVTLTTTMIRYVILIRVLSYTQASLEILDRIPTAKREQVKQRRAALVCIFSFLDTRTLSRVARVCREWRIVSRSPKLWRRVEIRGEKISSQFLRQISRRCSQLRVLILEDLHPRNRNHEESVEDYQKNIRCSLEIGYEQILKKAEATLHTIVIVNCGTLFSAKCLWIASCCCRMLKHVTYVSDFDPINAEVMWALGSGCRELVTLKCQPIFPCVHADNFTTKCAQLVGKCFRDLEIVSIGGLIVEVNAMIFIAKQCQKLREIEVHQMRFISCDIIDEMCQNGIQSLRSIQFLATPVAPGALAVLQGNCKHLDVIYIQLTESDFTASVTDQSATSQIPEYHEIVDGYEALKNQPSLCNILALKVERPKTPQPVKEPLPERSFFDRLFGKNE